MMKVKQHRAGAENLRIFSGHSGTLLELSYSSSALYEAVCSVFESKQLRSLSLSCRKEISGVCKRSRVFKGRPEETDLGAERYLAL